MALSKIQILKKISAYPLIVKIYLISYRLNSRISLYSNCTAYNLHNNEISTWLQKLLIMV